MWCIGWILSEWLPNVVLGGQMCHIYRWAAIHISLVLWLCATWKIKIILKIKWRENILIISLSEIPDMARTNVFLEKTSTTATISWNASYIEDTLLEHYAHDIMYKLYSDDSYETTPIKGAVERPSFRLSNLEHNNNYVFNVRPYRLLIGTKELGTPSEDITFKTDCVGQYHCSILFCKRVLLIIIAPLLSRNIY